MSFPTIQHSAFSIQHSERWLPPALLIVCAVLTFANGFGSGFVGLDAKESIRDNPYIRRLWPLTDAMSLSLVDDTLAADAGSKGGTVVRRPILSLSFAIDHRLWGLNPWGYHLANLAIHTGTALLLFAIVRRTVDLWYERSTREVRKGDRSILPQTDVRLSQRIQAENRSVPFSHLPATPIALAIALLWMLHPLQTESVTYLVQRGESLMSFFFLLTLYCALRGATGERPGRWYAGSIAACVLGMGTKEVMVVAPLVVLLFDRTFVAGSFWRAVRRRWHLYAGLAATWSILAALIVFTLHDAGKDFEGGRMASYAMAQPRVLLHYLRLALWPHPLHVYVNTTTFAITAASEVILPALVMAGLAGLTLWGVARRHWLGFLGAWFFLILAPSSSVVATSDLIQEHRMYLPLASVVALAVVAGAHLLRRRLAGRARRAAGVAAVAVVAIVYASMSIDRNRDYDDEFSFVHPADLPNAQTILAHHEANQGNLLQAAALFEAVLVHMTDPIEIAEAAYDLGNLFARHGQFERARHYYHRAIEANRNFDPAHNNLGALLVHEGRLPEARQALLNAVDQNPNAFYAHNNLGLVYIKLGDLAEAEQHFAVATQSPFIFEDAHKNLAFVREYRENGPPPAFDLSLTIPPGYGEAAMRLRRVAPGFPRVVVQK